MHDENSQERITQHSGRYVEVIETRRAAHGAQPSSALTRARNRLLALMCAIVAGACLLASQGIIQNAAMLGAGLELRAMPGSEAADPDEPAAVERASRPLPAAPVTQTATASAKDYDPRVMPKDIQVLMAEAQEEFANQKRDGDIKEKTYTANDSTHQFGSLAVRNTTVTEQERDIAKDLAAPLDLRIDKSKAAVLIFHTHTTEAFEILDRPWYAQDWTSRTENGARSIVRVGDAVAESLERAGFQVVHDTTIYDRKYTGAYDQSRVGVLRALEENPSIQVTLDVHRDAIHTDKGVHIKPVAVINGKKAAQVMIITGVNEGAITDFPDWAKNLAFAAKLQASGNETAPGLMRPLFFSPRKYNMNVTPYSLLLEFGSDANTLEEAVYSGRLMGTAIANLLNQYSQ
ncbi:MAG: stage II sporulation protein P [Oscillospiraceae bacterium]|jgi:stage II sporulation protein P|nr:stage II sporulation protein P [Oscillospiraceae bacterium]